MLYCSFQNLSLSALGFGCMRLPVAAGSDAEVDVPAVNAMVAEAMASGINYFDTAWGYHGGQSETIVGRALAAYPRASFYLASKFPGYDLANMPKVREIFERQLEKCGTDYFDFYLFHNVCEMNIDAYLDDGRFGIYTYLKEQRDRGRIRHLGFSVHGSLEVMKRFLDAYGSDMEFAQIQLNYLDWNFQDAKAKVEELNRRGIPIWVMEPLRGGALTKLDAPDEALLHALRPRESIHGWAFRFLQSVPGVTMVLSGMSSLAQMQDNIRIFCTHEPLSLEESNTLLGIAQKMCSAKTLPCTSCRYCVDHCPMGLDIPRLLSLYNEHVYSGGGFLAPMALMAIDARKQPADCIGCRSCEAVCPQQLKISEAMADFSSLLKA